MRSTRAGFLLVMLFVALPRVPAAAQGFGARVTPDGLDALTTVAMSRVPRRYDVAEMRRDLVDCPGSRTIWAEIPETEVRIAWRELDLSTEDGSLVVAATLDASASTPVVLHNPYACFGEETCDADVRLRNLGVVVTLAAGTDPGGGIALHGAAVDIELAPDDLHVDSAGCAIGDVATWLLDAFDRWALDQVIPRLEEALSERVASALSDVLSSTLGLSIEHGGLAIDAWLDSLDLSAALGVTVGGDADISFTGPVVTFIEAPRVEAPFGDALHGDMAGQLQVAVADALVTEALYEAWRGGLLSELLADQSRTIDLGGEGAAQSIGLPAGTTLDIAVDFEAPLAARFGRAAPGVVELDFTNLHVTVGVGGAASDPSTIDILASGALGATVGVDPDLGALVLDIRSLEVTSIVVRGEEDELSIDGARLRGFLSGTILPLVSERLAGLPVAPALQPVAGSYLHIRALESEGGWQRVGADLHTPDPSDDLPPDTALDDPRALLGAGTATFDVSGVDDTTPDTLLRYRAWLDGEPLRDGAASGVRSVRFDAPDGEHVLEVAALDLNGNEDPIPVRHAFVVDGVAPELVVTESPDAIVAGSAVRAAWEAHDERGSAVESAWAVRVTEDDGSTRVVQEAPFGPDTGSLAVSTAALDEGALYVLEIVVRDAAGNVTSESFGFAVQPSSGCSAAGAASASPLPTLALCLVLGCLLYRRR